MSQAFQVTHMVQVINSCNKKLLWEKLEKNHFGELGINVTTVNKHIFEVCLDLCVELAVSVV
jgi:hypothetical protein